MGGNILRQGLELSSKRTEYRCVEEETEREKPKSVRHLKVGKVGGENQEGTTVRERCEQVKRTL